MWCLGVRGDGQLLDIGTRWNISLSDPHLQGSCCSFPLLLPVRSTLETVHWYNFQTYFYHLLNAFFLCSKVWILVDCCRAEKTFLHLPTEYDSSGKLFVMEIPDTSASGCHSLICSPHRSWCFPYISLIIIWMQSANHLFFLLTDAPDKYFNWFLVFSNLFLSSHFGDILSLSEVKVTSNEFDVNCWMDHFVWDAHACEMHFIMRWNKQKWNISNLLYFLARAGGN